MLEEKYKEIICDGNIYYITPCINDCGIKWLTSDEIDNGHVCSLNCPKDKEKGNESR